MAKLTSDGGPLPSHRYGSYKTSTDLDSWFDIDLNATDPSSGDKLCVPPQGGCGQNAKVGKYRVRPRLNYFSEPTTVFAAAKIGAASLAISADPPPPPQPNISFADQFTTDEDSTMTINQGGIVEASGDICCDGNAPQCQIQYQHAKGTRYTCMFTQAPLLGQR